MTSIIWLAMNAAQAANRSPVLPEQQKLPARLAVKKVEKEITILNRHGLDRRLATLVAQAMSWFASEVWIAKNGNEVDGKSVLGLLILGAKPGARLHIRVEGADAAEAMQEIERLIAWSEDRGDSPAPQTP